jgi:alkylation response protein AidB-like acyl-CoA dehydrogenase
VDFQLSPEQIDLADATRTLCTGRLGLDTLRAALDKPLDRRVWGQLVDAGVLSIWRAEPDGGLGMGLAAAAVVFVELGAALAPGPLVWTTLAGSLPDPPALEAVVGGLDLGGDGSVRDVVTPMVIEHLDDLDLLIVLDADGVHLVDPKQVKARAVTALDPLTPVSVVHALGETRPVAGADEAQQWRQCGAVLAAAQLSGIATAVGAMATAYAKERHQFDRPIGSFQAIKHKLADMWVLAELARPQTFAAAVAIDEHDPDAPRAVSSAKIVAAHAAIDNATSAIQVFGGMGYTWEADPHLYLKRAWALDNLFGTADDHAEYVATTVA